MSGMHNVIGTHSTLCMYVCVCGHLLAMCLHVYACCMGMYMCVHACILSVYVVCVRVSVCNMLQTERVHAFRIST